MTENIEGSSSSALSRALDVTGWLLTEAQAALHADSSTLPVRLIETGPPARKARNHAPEDSDSRKSARAPIVLGDWRVLRCRVVETEVETETEPTLELLIAREQRV